MFAFIETLFVELLSIGAGGMWLILTPNLPRKHRLLTVRHGSAVSFETL